MAISFRTVGTWAELTADGSVAIPATPQSGDRMYLFARWKDFSITAQVTSPSGWTKLTEFADGSVSSGNGTGSVKVACWYRDWQSGDTDPTIDFSASPTTASAVIIVMAKGAGEGWLTPVAVTAAMTTWTISSQSVSASSTANVPGAGVVMGLIGIRDDTATMTRPTNGIDDASSAITWNGNYVEAPATHHSTTTGDDGAADLGYRLVTTGATATLRMTGTISAAETGAALWVVQGIESNLSIDNSSHTHTAANAVLTQVHSLTVQNAAHAQTAANPALTQTHGLSVQNASHSHASENLSLSQVHILTIQGASHGHTAGSLTLEIIHHLVIQDVAHAHSAETLTLAQVHELVIADALHDHLATSPNVRTYLLTYLDPGGDAVQATGFFNSITGNVSFDNTQQVAGAGSWKHESGAGNQPATSTISNVLGVSSRAVMHFRYDLVPDTAVTISEFCEDNAVYSGGGFADPANTNADDGFYATATPARNAGQGSKCNPISPLDIPIGAVIDSVKIIYERKYDTDASIGVSRVKWVVNGAEGPNHDNTDMPLTDTVVEVDVTTEFGWTEPDLRAGVFEIVAEARRGDTDVEHTQSWDFLKVEVVYHTAVQIANLLTSSNSVISALGLISKGSGVAIRYTDAAGGFFDGITVLAPETFHAIGFAYNILAADQLSMEVYVNYLRELTVAEQSTGGEPSAAHLRAGWISQPGADLTCWIDCIAIDDGDDLSDIGNILSTAKLPAAVNADEFDTTGGTGAVNERPVNIANYRVQLATAQNRQNYTLEAADEGDVDISGEEIVGYMGWVIGKKSGLGGAFSLTLNGIDNNVALTTSPTLHKLPVTLTSYPSNAAGIGLRSSTGSQDCYLYDCGVVVGYRGPKDNPAIILDYQELAEGTILDLVDDLRANPPDSYELCFRAEETPATVLITAYSITAEGQEPQLQATNQAEGGGGGRTRITAGIEVQIRVEVTGGSARVGIWHRLNVD